MQAPRADHTVSNAGSELIESRLFAVTIAIQLHFYWRLSRLRGCVCRPLFLCSSSVVGFLPCRFICTVTDSAVFDVTRGSVGELISARSAAPSVLRNPRSSLSQVLGVLPAERRVRETEDLAGEIASQRGGSDLQARKRPVAMPCLAMLGPAPLCSISQLLVMSFRGGTPRRHRPRLRDLKLPYRGSALTLGKV